MAASGDETADETLGCIPWVVAGTPLGRRYPCTCRGARCDPTWCKCAGRPDVEDAPARCCSRYNTAAVAAQAQNVYDLERARLRRAQLAAERETDNTD